MTWLEADSSVFLAKETPQAAPCAIEQPEQAPGSMLLSSLAGENFA